MQFLLSPDVASEPSQISSMGLFMKVVNGILFWQKASSYEITAIIEVN